MRFFEVASPDFGMFWLGGFKQSSINKNAAAALGWPTSRRALNRVT